MTPIWFSAPGHRDEAATGRPTSRGSIARARNLLVMLWLAGMLVGIWALLIMLLLTGKVAGTKPDLGSAYNSGNYSQCTYEKANQSLLPAPIYDVFAAVAGKDVPVGKLILVLTILGPALLIVITLLSNTVYSSVISLGRNPLAGRQIVGALARVLALAGVVLGLSTAVVWIVLRA
jgi:hypothetical protein